MKRIIVLLLGLVLTALGFVCGYLYAIESVVIENQKARIVLSARVLDTLGSGDIDEAVGLLENQVVGLNRTLQSVERNRLSMLLMQPQTYGTIPEVLLYVRELLGEKSTLMDGDRNDHRPKVSPDSTSE